MNNEQLKRGEELLAQLTPLRLPDDEDYQTCLEGCDGKHLLEIAGASTDEEQDELITLAVMVRLNSWPLLRDACIEFVRLCERAGGNTGYKYAQIKAALKEAGIGGEE